MKKIIPYGKHFIDKADIKEVVKVLKSNSITQGPLSKFEKKSQSMLMQNMLWPYQVALQVCTYL